LARLEAGGWTIHRLGVDSQGRVEAPAMPDGPVGLGTLILAQNEVGAIQPVTDFAARVHAAGGVVHTDGAQAVGKIPVSVDELNVDLLSIAGHKLYAPKGVGALYIRRGTSVQPVLVGAGQERQLRPGTENVASIVGLGSAAELADGDLSPRCNVSSNSVNCCGGSYRPVFVTWCGSARLMDVCPTRSWSPSPARSALTCWRPRIRSRRPPEVRVIPACTHRLRLSSRWVSSTTSPSARFVLVWAARRPRPTFTLPRTRWPMPSSTRSLDPARDANTSTARRSGKYATDRRKQATDRRKQATDRRKQATDRR